MRHNVHAAGLLSKDYDGHVRKDHPGEQSCTGTIGESDK